MSRGISFHPDARLEVSETVRRYERERLGLDRQFVTELRETVDHVLQNPYSGAPGEEETRRKYLRRFPYTLINLVGDVDKHIYIIAVMHQHREPGYWRNRL